MSKEDRDRADARFNKAARSANDAKVVVLRESGGPSIPETLEINRRGRSVLGRPVKAGR